MEIRTDYSNVRFQDNGKLKLLIIVGTRPEIIRLAAVINKCRKYFDCILAHTGQMHRYSFTKSPSCTALLRAAAADLFRA